MEQTNTPTLGARIQAGRRAAGLSQEALGEKLGVSRQAVSKWEADAAIPELENLIAMSRIFQLSLGALLGVEPPSAPEGQETPVTEGELAAAIAAQYASARPRRYRRWAWVVGAAAAVAVAVGLIVQTVRLEGQLAGLEMQIAALEGQVSSLESRVAHLQSISVPGTVGTSSRLLESSLEITEVDLAAQTATWRVSATLNEQQAGATAVFVAQFSDGQRSSREAVADQGAFTAEGWVIPMAGDIQFSLILTEGDTNRTESLGAVEGVTPENAQVVVEGGWDADFAAAGKTVTLGDVQLEILPTELTDRIGTALTAVDLCLYRNRQTRPEQVLPVEELADSFNDYGAYGPVSVSNWSGCETSVTLEEGDTVVAAARVRDDLGQTTYTVMGCWTLRNAMLQSLGDAETWRGWAPGDAVKSST